MKLIIDISNNLYSACQTMKDDQDELMVAVAEGVPLVEGEWVIEEERRDSIFDWCPNECSICGEKFTKYIRGWEWEETGELPKFCPNCGAKMKEE